MQLIRLTDTYGLERYINPEMISCVCKSKHVDDKCYVQVGAEAFRLNMSADEFVDRICAIANDKSNFSGPAD